MKNVFIMLLIVHFTLNIEDCICQWTVISTQGNTAVSFPSENTGFSTANGITKKTTNGGYNWSSLSGGNLTGIFFINNLTGWVVGYPGYIGKTINGSSFTQQPTGIQDRLNEVFFINENTGWVVGGDFSNEVIFKTTNGGINWTTQTSGTANKLFSVYFINENTGWSVGGPSSPKIIKTTNGGQNWFMQSTTISTPLYSVMFANENTGWAVAGYLGGETIIKTTNGGINWFSQSSGDTRYLRDCYVIDSLKAVAVGQGGKIIATTNGGDNWSVISTSSSVELWAVDFASDSVGYAIGSNVVLKTTNGGLTFYSENSNQIPNKFGLEQNYPNPFNSMTNVKFKIANAGNVSLKVFDLLGREVSTLVDEKLQPGTYQANFNAENLSSGVYFYRLKTDGFSETKKLLLIK
ncbi:MAG: T9SS type A sorting domain-containing protein [Ignavibacteria bacterium]|nr:T9SS type A sorting domain-containing protein [Ignavibacteria bacterium]